MNKLFINIKPIVVFVSELTKVYSDNNHNITVLNCLNLEVEEGEIIAIVGPSGTGKSTLLHILGGLDTQTYGNVEINGINIHNLTEDKRSKFRNKYLGFIYQFHHLLPEFNAVENIAIPLLISGIKYKDAISKSHEMLSHVHLEDRWHHKIGELSGGEKQRIAIARALITKPKCVLADEPTGNLDYNNAMLIYDLIFMLKKNFNTSFIIVTHDLNIIKKVDRVLILQNGKLTSK